MLPDSLRLLGQKWIAREPWYLAPFSWAFAFGVFLRNWLYDHKLLPTVTAACTVVSVGNIVAGGSGKTPFIRWLASHFAHRKVAILSRGYGYIADEAMLLAGWLPNAKVFVHKNRAQLAKKIGHEFDLIILDDGFQHRKLERDFDIVLHYDAKHYLPWGFLRDSPKRLKQAMVFQEHELRLAVSRIRDLEGRSISSIAGKKVGLFCGIARPERFRKTVQNLGAIIAFEKMFADHGAIDLSALPPADLYVCTEKDAVKLPKTALPILVIETQVVVNKPLNEIEKWIEKIDKSIDNRATYE